MTIFNIIMAIIICCFAIVLFIAFIVAAAKNVSYNIVFMMMPCALAIIFTSAFAGFVNIIYWCMH